MTKSITSAAVMMLHEEGRLALSVLVQGTNTFELLSDTKHHGIEILLPGPALIVSVRQPSAADAGSTEDGADDGAAEDLAAYERHALTHTGNVQRGRQLFFSEEITRCAICHKAGDAGGDIGPDLSSIGGKFDRPHLVESLLQPSKQTGRCIVAGGVSGAVLFRRLRQRLD